MLGSQVSARPSVQAAMSPHSMQKRKRRTASRQLRQQRRTKSGSSQQQRARRRVPPTSSVFSVHRRNTSLRKAARARARSRRAHLRRQAKPEQNAAQRRQRER